MRRWTFRCDNSSPGFSPAWRTKRPVRFVWSLAKRAWRLWSHAPEYASKQPVAHAAAAFAGISPKPTQLHSGAWDALTDWAVCSLCRLAVCVAGASAGDKSMLLRRVRDSVYAHARLATAHWLSPFPHRNTCLPNMRSPVQPVRRAQTAPAARMQCVEFRA